MRRQFPERESVSAFFIAKRKGPLNSIYTLKKYNGWKVYRFNFKMVLLQNWIKTK